MALSIVIGTVNNLHIGFKCGSINFYMQRKQTAKYQHHGITPLRFIKLRNHFPVIKSCDKFSQLNKTSKLIQARNFAFTFPVVLVCILCKNRSFILEIYEPLISKSAKRFSKAGLKKLFVCRHPTLGLRVGSVRILFCFG